MKLTVGIFFGGKNRDTAWSVAAATTLSQYLDSNLFEPLPIFVNRQLQLFLPHKNFDFPIHQAPDTWAKPIAFEQLPDLINIAWITLHAEFADTPDIQQQLLDLGIPFTGNPPAQHQMVWDKVVQKNLLLEQHIATPPFRVLTQQEIDQQAPEALLSALADFPGFPCTLNNSWGEVPAAGSLLDTHTQPADFLRAANRALFREVLLAAEWLDRSEYEKYEFVQLICDPREGLGLPIQATSGTKESVLLQSPETLFAFLEESCTAASSAEHPVLLEHPDHQKQIIVEQVPDGKDFSCFVIRDKNNEWLALPPTSRHLKDEIYFFFHPNAAHFSDPELLDLSDSQRTAIRQVAEKIATRLDISTLLQIEGTLTSDNRILIAEIRNTAKLNEGAPVFQLAATSGLTPVPFLTQQIRTALYERSREFPEKPTFRFLYTYLEEQLSAPENAQTDKQSVGIFLSDMHRDQELALESARFLFSQLEASTQWQPHLYYIIGQTPFFEFYQVPNHWLFMPKPWSLFQRMQKSTKILPTGEDKTPFKKKNTPATAEKILPTDLKDRIQLAWLCFGDIHPNTDKISQLLNHLGIPGTGQSRRYPGNKTSLLSLLEQQGIAVLHQQLPEAGAIAARVPVVTRPDGSLHVLPALSLTLKEISGNIRFHGKQSFIFEQHPDRAAQLEKEAYPIVQQIARIVPLTDDTAIDILVVPKPDGASTILVADMHNIPWIYKDSARIRLTLLQGDSPLKELERILAHAKNKTHLTQAPNAADLATKKEDAMETPQHQSETPPSGTEGNPNAFLQVLQAQAKYFLQTLGAFVLSPIFRRNMLALLGTLAVLYVVLALVLRLFTHHGSSLQIQDFTGMQVAIAQEKARAGKLELVVTDSIFSVDETPGIVLTQYPKPFSRIKKNRSVYVTVNSSSPPPVILPSLVGTYDYGQYTRKLQRLGIKYRLIEKRFDAKLEENTILFVYFNGKEVSDEELRQGFKIPKGSTVDFIVSERKSNLVSIPDLRCKTYNQAVFVLNSMGLDIGQILGDVADYNYAYVYKQDPSPTEALTASLGTRVNLYLSDTLPDDCATTEGAADSLSNNY